VLATSLVLARRPMTSQTVLAQFVRHPLMTQRTMALIHWHAFRLWRRGVPFQRHRDQGRPPVAAHGAIARAARPAAGTASSARPDAAP
jgi:DUF1365 family protein